jgi:hypothetical protein
MNSAVGDDFPHDEISRWVAWQQICQRIRSERHSLHERQHSMPEAHYRRFICWQVRECQTLVGMRPQNISQAQAEEDLGLGVTVSFSF